MKPTIVAEIGASHHRNLRRTIATVEAAAKAGVDSVKLQTFTPDTMVADKSWTIPSGPWAGRNLYQLYQEAALPLEWHPTLFQVARDNGIECFSTPFDESAVEFLERLDCPRYKVASFEITDLELLKAIAKTGKPMVISTGMATQDEIGIACFTAVNAGCGDITLLKCTSAYPATAKDANIGTMPHMRDTFGWPFGLSDHTTGIAVPVAAAMLGAAVIEKHIKLDDETGPDSHFALNPEQFKSMVQAVRDAMDAKGEVRYGPTEGEQPSTILRRSIYAVRDISKGEVFSQSNIALRRPNCGLPAKDWPFVTGQTAKRDIRTGQALSVEDVR